MTKSPDRRRAPAMSPADRRQMILRTALPLVAAHGAGISTAQVARAAGVADGTLFRAYPDKQALLDACVAAVLDPADALAALQSIPPELPLADRLTEAVQTLRAHLGR